VILPVFSNEVLFGFDIDCAVDCVTDNPAKLQVSSCRIEPSHLPYAVRWERSQRIYFAEFVAVEVYEGYEYA